MHESYTTRVQQLKEEDLDYGQLHIPCDVCGQPIGSWNEKHGKRTCLACLTAQLHRAAHELKRIDRNIEEYLLWVIVGSLAILALAIAMLTGGL